jgi:hypothetical protein
LPFFCGKQFGFDIKFITFDIELPAFGRGGLGVPIVNLSTNLTPKYLGTMKKIIQLSAMCALVLGLAVINSCSEPPREDSPGNVNNPPTAPTNLRATNVTVDGATLLWDGDAESYDVMVGDEHHEVAATSYTLTELTADTRYEWSVRAVSGDLTSEWVAGEPFTTLPKDEPDPVPVPQNLRESDITHTSATLLWDAVEDVSGYEVLFGTDETPIEVEMALFVHTILTPETEYTWKVRAVKDDRRSEWAQHTFTTRKEPLGSFEDFDVTDITHNSAVLSWNPIIGATRYDVVVVGINEEIPVSVTEPTYTVTGLTPETGYAWKVRAIRDGETGEWADGDMFTTTEEPLAPPTNLQVTNVTHKKANISWDAVPEVDGYHIRVNDEILTSDGVFTGTSAILTLVNPDADYTWAVSAVKGDKQSVWAEGEPFRTLPTPASDPLEFADLLGKNYSAVGAPFLNVLLTPPSPEGPSSWAGSIGAVEDLTDIYEFTNFVGTGNDNPNYAEPVLVSYVSGKLSVADSYFIMRWNLGSQIIRSRVGGIYLDDASMVPPDGSIEVFWDEETKTLTFADEANGRPIGIGFFAHADTSPYTMLGYWSDFYTDIVFTLDEGASGRAVAMHGKIVDMKKISTAAATPALEKIDRANARPVSQRYYKAR